MASMARLNVLEQEYQDGHEVAIVMEEFTSNEIRNAIAGHLKSAGYDAVAGDSTFFVKSPAWANAEIKLITKTCEDAGMVTLIEANEIKVFDPSSK